VREVPLAIWEALGILVTSAQLHMPENNAINFIMYNLKKKNCIESLLFVMSMILYININEKPQTFMIPTFTGQYPRQSVHIKFFDNPTMHVICCFINIKHQICKTSNKQPYIRSTKSS